MWDIILFPQEQLAEKCVYTLSFLNRRYFKIEDIFATCHSPFHQARLAFLCRKDIYHILDIRNWACCIGEKSDQRRAKIDRQKDVRLEKTRRAKRGQSPRWTRIRGNSFWFRYANISPSIVTPPATYVTRRKNAPTVPPDRTDCRG